MRPDLQALLAAIETEARREEFPIDTPVYEAADRDPLVPLLIGGRTEAPVAFLGRDLGKDEVRHGEPLIGAGGKLVRAGIERAGGAVDRVLLTNTVPYKPPGNKAYSQAVKRRFRPFLAALLATCWTGEVLITLGNQAYAWFRPYDTAGDLAAFWADESRRYTERVAVTLTAEWDDETHEKTIELAPLPHPSPLNARWYGKFPALLDARLAGLM